MMVLVASAVGWQSASAQSAPVMTSPPPPPGVAGTGYLHQFNAGPLELVFGVTQGTLPPGIVLTPQGFLVGIPTTAGTFGPTTVCATSLLFPPACQVVTIVITQRTPAILAAPSAGGPLGTRLWAAATLVGAFLPTGSMTFRLFADASCTAQVFASETPLLLYGEARSGEFVPLTPGTYRWTMTYPGDVNNRPVSTRCHDAGTVVITAASTTVPSTTTSTTTPTTIPGPTGNRYVPLSPARIGDTRTGAGGLSGPVGPGATVAVQVAGRGGVPAEATAVVMNVTVTQPTASGYLTLSPDGSPRPLPASVSFAPGRTVPRLVVVELGTGGRVATFNSAGDTHVVYDVAGYFTAGAGSSGRYQPLVPARIADTRFSAGGVRLGPGQSFDLQVSGQGGAPAQGASAAVLNVAATGTTAHSYLTVYPTGEPQPPTANLTFAAGETVSNSAMVKLGAGGRVTVYNNAGETDVVVDITGTYTDASVAGSAGAYTPLAPARIYDTRLGAPTPAGGTEELEVTGVGGVPATGVRAVILSVAVTQPAGPGSLTTFPAGAAQPPTSDLNYATGETRSNLVVAQVGAGGRVVVSPSTRAHVLVDVVGWFS